MPVTVHNPDVARELAALNKTLASLLDVQTKLLETERAIAESVAMIADELKAEPPVPATAEIVLGQPQ